MLVVASAVPAALAMRAAATDNNLIANPSVEASIDGHPTNWQTNVWGSSQNDFTYENDARTGAKSLKVTMLSRQSGDAKWWHDPVDVNPGQTYTFSDYYKASVETHYVVYYYDADGSEHAQYVKTVGASHDVWQQGVHTFTVPDGAERVRVFHLISSTGWLQTDDYAIVAGTDPYTPTPDPDPSPDPDPDPVDPGPVTPGANLLSNPSFEVADGATPADWRNNAWGDNTADFVYETTGRSGSRSATVHMTAHVDGDAKWYAEPVAVSAGETYVYRDFYKATVPTSVVVACIDQDNNYGYYGLPAAAAASDWTEYAAEFVVPDGAVKATVFHLINTVGSVSLDDVELKLATPSAAPIEVPNASLEEGGENPTSWRNNSWGTNNPTFSYVTNDGAEGSRSVRIDMNDYVDGDAKWYFDPITTLTPGAQYRFSAAYKGTVVPHIVAMSITADGTARYFGMPSPAGVSESSWTTYSDTFTVPGDAQSVSVFMFVAANGWLQTDAYSVTEYHPSGFGRPLLTLTFDDGHEDNYKTALPMMQQYGYKSTQCYATVFLEGQSQQIIDGARAFYDAGHEICSHTVTHPFLTTLSAADVEYELQHSRQYLESLFEGYSVSNFASPYGDYNAAVKQAIGQHYGSHRSVDEGFNSKDNFDIYNIRVQNIFDTTSAEQVAAWIAQAQADNTWLVLVYHRVADDPGTFDSYTNVFAEHLEVIDRSGIAVQTYRDALAEVQAQL
ncbi:hypothetical protein CR970_04250 [Candidatus Saccharibacteria bacterium]|nr:MAG: hypothetical protein CR970_04250 [Candidatus Saccharibacteria bacterium]